jgi:hypothetical protein
MSGGLLIGVGTPTRPHPTAYPPARRRQVGGVSVADAITDPPGSSVGREDGDDGR